MNQQSEGDKNSTAILWAIGGLFILGWGVWFFFATQLKQGYINIKWAEAKLISYFTDNILATLYWLDGALGEELSLETAIKINEEIGLYFQVPIIMLLTAMLYVLWRKQVSLRFNRPHSMQSLIEQEQKNWPQISPVVKIKNMVDLDINEGPWAMGMNPMQFCKKHKLLEVILESDSKAVWRAEGVYKATLLEEKATKIFTFQVGAQWEGIDKLTPVTKAMFAIFAARIEHDTDAAFAMLRQLASSYSKGKLDYSGIDNLIRKYGNAKAVQRCIKKHAYVLTVMASMLELARIDGVLASADFIWLKVEDRRLWYVLNGVGRQVAFCEVAGPFAHWKAEKEMGRALHVPEVSCATDALKLAIAKAQYVPDEEEEKQVE